MKFRFVIPIFVFIACVFVRHSYAQEKPKPIPTRQTPQRNLRDLVMKPVVYRVAGMDEVTVKSNFKYIDVENPNLLMDVYSPPNLAKGEKRPAVIFIHGAASAEYKPKDWGFYISWGRLLGASGLVGVNFTHRLSGQKTSLEDAAGDVAAATNYIRKNADSLNIDKNRICLAAYSAGGVLLAPAIRDNPDYVRCLVSFYAYMDIRQSGNFFAASESAETRRKFSPINYLANGSDRIAPMFIARAGLGQIPTMNDSIDRFIGEALAKNVALTFANHPNGVHGFDNQTDDERSREIIQSAIVFMKLHLVMTKVAK